MADGTLMLSMKTSGWYDIKKWILSFGFEAKLIEPEEKIEEMKTVISKMMSEYVMDDKNIPFTNNQAENGL